MKPSKGPRPGAAAPDLIDSSSLIDEQEPNDRCGHTTQLCLK